MNFEKKKECFEFKLQVFTVSSALKFYCQMLFFHWIKSLVILILSNFRENDKRNDIMNRDGNQRVQRGSQRQ